MEKRQMDAIANAILGPLQKAQHRRALELAADASRRTEGGNLAWFGIAGLMTGVISFRVTGGAFSDGALLGVAAGCFVGYVVRLVAAKRSR
jgi:hypothetical protein